MKETMNSKERVKRAFAHVEADRVPIDYLCNPGIDARLKAYYGLKGDDTEGLKNALGVDFREVDAPYIGPSRFEPVEGRHIDEWGMRAMLES